MGYSLGAFDAFYIAAAERDPSHELIDFDRYLTLDAPVRLLEGLHHLDDFYNAPMVFPREERTQRVRAILHKVLDLAQGDLSPEEELPFSNLEAEFLIGLTFRLTLQDTIFSSQQREDQGVLLTQRGSFRRGSAYEEIADYSFARYVLAFVAPYYRDQLGRVSSIDDLLAQNDLRFIADDLRGNNKIRHFANKNDFLTNDEDVAWITQLLGEERVRFFPTGGHLGNLYKPEVQEELMDALRDLLEVAAE